MSVVVLVVILCCLVFALCSWRRRRLPAPPTLPGALPIIGHAHLVNGDRKHLWNFVKSIFTYSLEKSSATQFFIGPHTYYVLTDPDECLKVANTCFGKNYFYNFAKDFLNNGLITAEASVWKTHRKLLNPAFNQQVLNTFINIINVQSESLASQLASELEKDSFDVRHYMVSFTLSTVSRTSLGLNAHDQSVIDKDYAAAVDDLFCLYCDRFQKVWLHLSYIFNWSALKRRQDKLISTLNNIINPLIQKRKFELKASQVPEIDYDPAPDKFKPILDLMLHLAEEQDAFTDDDIREHLDTLVAASYDTTSAAMTIMLLVVGTYPDIQERIFSELQEVLDHKEEHLTKYHLQKLVYTEAVIKESLRLYPPVPLIGRKIDTDVKLKNYTLQAGNSCIIGPYGMNRHPMWGADAQQFRPERWLDPSCLPDNPNAFAAFGVGKRNCIGKLYSMMVMKTALAHILQRYYVTGDITKVVFEFDIVIKPVENHHITLKLRK